MQVDEKNNPQGTTFLQQLLQEVRPLFLIEAIASGFPFAPKWNQVEEHGGEGGIRTPDTC